MLTHDGVTMEPASHKGNHQDGLTNKFELAGISQNGPELASKPLYMGFQRAARPRPVDSANLLIHWRARQDSNL